ncbi:hypothetical protein DVH24_019779 [Malus domestica]|uniref:Uncharacterized protein n=1 Tax=Malus domestica TaxID=3750 RepID=A0A498I5X7_MALDO|nr:hypothetical protein DVH24_019779 [Malus domestica]
MVYGLLVKLIGKKKNQGKWKNTYRWNTILDPLNGEPFIREDIKIFINFSLLKNSTVKLCNNIN